MVISRISIRSIIYFIFVHLKKKDFSSDGIRNIIESTVPSLHARQQLLNYISQLQIAAYAHSSKDHSSTNENETNLLRVRFHSFLF